MRKNKNIEYSHLTLKFPPKALSLSSTHHLRFGTNKGQIFILIFYNYTKLGTGKSVLKPTTWDQIRNGQVKLDKKIAVEGINSGVFKNFGIRSFSADHRKQNLKTYFFVLYPYPTLIEWNFELLTCEVAPTRPRHETVAQCSSQCVYSNTFNITIVM